MSRHDLFGYALPGIGISIDDRMVQNSGNNHHGHFRAFVGNTCGVSNGFSVGLPHVLQSGGQSPPQQFVAFGVVSGCEWVMVILLPSLGIDSPLVWQLVSVDSTLLFFVVVEMEGFCVS